MNNAFNKDIFREIKNTFGRFMGLFAIVALGVSFFSGIGATGYDMKITVSDYLVKQNLMDIRVVSNYGLTNKDVAALKEIKGVRQVFPTYNLDAQVTKDANSISVKVHAIDTSLSPNEQMNKPVLTAGELPQKGNEALVEPSFLSNTGYEIGDTFTLESGKKKDIRNLLKTKTYKIVGVANSPYYLSHERGNGSIGDGKIDSFIIIGQENFMQNVYSEAFITVDLPKDILCFSDEYTKIIDGYVETIENVGKIESERRDNELTSKSYETLNLSEEQIQASINELQLMDGTEVQILQLKGKLAEIAKSRTTLYDLSEPKWYVLDRDTNLGYSAYSEDSDKIEAIGKVFPLIFFIVAALVSLTTMTRMVEERRTEIGTLKSLGYKSFKIMSKYIIYAMLPTLLGGVVGGYFGMKLFPLVIISSYNMMYTTSAAQTPINLQYWSIGILMAVVCTTLATVFACLNELRATPSNLMRPKAPKAGKRTFLEVIPFFWSSLSFSYKVTIRNILRYKKRFYMTIIGIGGCTALLMTGFGIRDSISDIISIQFEDLYKYNTTISFDDNVKNNDINNVYDVLNKSPIVQNSLTIRQKVMDAGVDEKAKTNVSIVVFEELNHVDNFIKLRDRKTKEPLEVQEDGVTITEKLAKNLSLNVGDVIFIKDGDEVLVQAKVTGITEHYFQHYIYMSKNYYKTLFGEDVEYNAIYSIFDNEKTAEKATLTNTILDKKSVTSVAFSESIINNFDDIINNLNFVVLILIMSAGALAFVVLLNLTNININERIRELATIEVLGFYDKEVSAYVFRENVILTFIGAGLGLVLGIALHAYVMSTVETDIMMFGKQIKPLSFVYSTILTLFFSFCVNIISSGKLKKINMVEALKSVE